MINTSKLRYAAVAFEKAIRKYIAFTRDGDTFDCKKKLDFGTVTACCSGGEASLWVLFPNKRIAIFECVKLDKSLLWVHKSQPNTIHTTLQLFRGLSAWWDGAKWVEEQKETEAAKCSK